MGISLVVADDHEVVRQGLKSLLEGSDINIVGEAADGNEAVKVTKKCNPDVVLLDIRMPEGDGLAALEAIQSSCPETKVVMLSRQSHLHCPQCGDGCFKLRAERLRPRRADLGHRRRCRW